MLHFYLAPEPAPEASQKPVEPDQADKPAGDSPAAGPQPEAPAEAGQAGEPARDQSAAGPQGDPPSGADRQPPAEPGSDDVAEGA